jgi:hypothetical protein
MLSSTGLRGAGALLTFFPSIPGETALVAVNKHVDFAGHAATLELAETEAGEGHWSRRNGG